MASYAVRLQDDDDDDEEEFKEEQDRGSGGGGSCLATQMRDVEREQENALELNQLMITKLSALPRQKSLDAFSQKLYDATKQKCLAVYDQLQSLEKLSRELEQRPDASIVHRLGYTALQIVRQVASHPHPSEDTVKLGRHMSANAKKHFMIVLNELDRDHSSLEAQTFKSLVGGDSMEFNASDFKQSISTLMHELDDFDRYISDSKGNRPNAYARSPYVEEQKDEIIDADRIRPPSRSAYSSVSRHSGAAAAGAAAGRRKSAKKRSHPHRVQTAHGYVIDAEVSTRVWQTWQCPLPQTNNTSSGACGCGVCAKLVPLVADVTDVYMSVGPKVSRKFFIGLSELIQEDQFDIDGSLSEVTRGLFTRIGFEGEFVPVVTPPAPSVLAPAPALSNTHKSNASSRSRVSRASRGSRSRGSRKQRTATPAASNMPPRPMYRLKRTKRHDDLEFLRGSWLATTISDEICHEPDWIAQDLEWFTSEIGDHLKDTQMMFRKKSRNRAAGGGGGGGCCGGGSFLRNLYRYLSGCVRGVA